MKLQNLPEATREVTVIPSMPDRLLVRQSDGRFISMSVERFISLMVKAIREG